MGCWQGSFSVPVILGVFFGGVVELKGAEPPASSKETIVHDEAKLGDLKAIASNKAKAQIRVSEPGVFVVKGEGTDAVDDVDAFLFEVEGTDPFDFCLVAGAAEFKWIRSIEADGTQKDVAFGSTNPSFRAPRNIAVDGLPPGKYRVDLMFGPDGASGEWVAKIAPRKENSPRPKSLCAELVDPTTAEKMKGVRWPGLISIFHGHNWGEDEKYLTAIKECGFAGVGATEAQIEQCRKQGLRAFVFIWPHEAGVIPPKHKDDKTVLCYYLSDRVPPNKWGSWAVNEARVFKAAPRHPAIFTMRGLWGGIDQYCSVVRGRAMEFYHYHWDGNRSPHMHFALLEQFRKASAANGHVPICRVVETRPEDMRKTRQTIFTSLAYGVRAFRTGGRGIFEAGRDERDVPKRNANGEEFWRINATLKAFAPVFVHARCLAVYHTAPLPAGCQAAPRDSWVRPEGKEIVLGVFQEPASKETRYLVVANRDAFAAHEASVWVAHENPTVWRRDRDIGKWVPAAFEKGKGGVRITLPLEEGGVELLKVSRKNAN